MSVLDIIPGGSYIQSAVKKAGFEAAKIKGEAGKLYYGAITGTTSAVTATAEAAQKVTTGIRNYAIYLMLAVALVLAWPFLAPMLAQWVTPRRS